MHRISNLRATLLTRRINAHHMFISNSPKLLGNQISEGVMKFCRVRLRVPCTLTNFFFTTPPAHIKTLKRDVRVSRRLATFQLQAIIVAQEPTQFAKNKGNHCLLSFYYSSFLPTQNYISITVLPLNWENCFALANFCNDKLL